MLTKVVLNRRNRRAVSNIVATMLIFAMMIASTGILYTRIAPALLGFDAKTKNTEQEFLLLNIANELEGLVISPEGSQTKVSVSTNEGVFNVSNGYALAISVMEGVTTHASYSTSIGEFTSEVSGSFQYEGNEAFISRTSNEDSLIQNDTVSLNSNYVAKVQYNYQNAVYTLYSKARINLIEVTPGAYTLTIVMVKIVFNIQGGTPLDFPVHSTDWTLRMRRQASTVTTSTVAIGGGFTVDHTIDGVAGTQYAFNTVAGTLDIRFIEVPILFSI